MNFEYVYHYIGKYTLFHIKGEKLSKRGCRETVFNFFSKSKIVIQYLLENVRYYRVIFGILSANGKKPVKIIIFSKFIHIFLI